MVHPIAFVVFLLVGSLLTVSTASLYTIRDKDDSFKWGFYVLAVITIAYWLSVSSL